MTIFSRENACLSQRQAQGLAQVLRPIAADLGAVETCLAGTLRQTSDPAVRELLDFLIDSPGKRIRPALLLLSAKAAGGEGGSQSSNETTIKVAAAVELIHMASLVHDDLIDGATVRHHRPSVNARWGTAVSIALGDHLCSMAFGLIADCEEPRLFAILGPGLCAMCEGELLQVADRSDFDLSEQHCLAVIEKKTAAFFGACCHIGASAANGDPDTCSALERFGFHLGMAFQIVDDCKDLLSDQKDLGKQPGQDWLAGDVTLPLLHGVRHGKGGWESFQGDGNAVVGRQLSRIHEAFHASQAPARLGRMIESHIGRAAQALQLVEDSGFRNSLQQLADRIATSVAGLLVR